MQPPGQRPQTDGGRRHRSPPGVPDATALPKRRDGGRFHPFNHPVLRLGTGDEPRCRLSNGLVMETVHLDGRAPRDSVQQRTLRHFHRMGKVGTGGLLLMLKQIFPLPVQILEHVSSGGHVQNLAPPADGQDRLSLLQHPPDEEDLQMISSPDRPNPVRESVPRRTRRDRCPRPRSAATRRSAPRSPESARPLHIRDNQRKPPCPQDGLQIFPAHRQRSPFIPGSGHSDDRPAHALPPPRRNRPKARSAVPAMGFSLISIRLCPSDFPPPP